jgi:hypothetical protein
VDITEDLIARGIPKGYYAMGLLLNRLKGIKHEFDQMGPGHWEWVEMKEGGNV